jgi:tetratricopeptide (TPR) repeat protein
MQIPDKQFLEEKIQYYSKDLSEHIIDIQKFKEVRATTWALSIRSSYNFIAMAYLFLNKLNQAKRYFYKAAEITSQTFDIFKQNRYPNLIKSEKLPFTSLFVKSFLDAILCDSEELLISYASVIYPTGEPSPGLEFNHEIGLAMKYLILQDYDKAIYHAQNAHQPEHFELPYKGFSHVIMGILQKDILLINQGILFCLNRHKREQKDSMFYSISLEATALAKLATRYGFQPDISSKFIHKGLLEKQEGIIYEGIDDILKALEIANLRNGNLLERIRGWLA